MQITTLSKRVIVRNTLIIVLCMAAGWYLKARLTPQNPMAGMMKSAGEVYVIAQKAELQNIAPQKKYIGKVEAINQVDLQPQITGYVERVLFEEGGFVKAGDLLFVIEPQRYEATVKLREAELDQAEANLEKVEKDYKRQSELNRQKFASEATLDTAKSALLQAKAAVKQAKASLDLARIDLGYTEIKAPISGYIGRALVTEGNYVNSATQKLARIVQVAPIRVEFSMTDKDFLNLKQKAQENGESAIKTELVLPNGTLLKDSIVSHFNNNEVNDKTATIANYVEYKNEQKWLIPGNFVTVKVSETADDKEAVVVPQTALAMDKLGDFVYVINQDSIAEERRVKLGAAVDGKQIVTEGLSADDTVIVQGLQKVKAGTKVKAGVVEGKEEL